MVIRPLKALLSALSTLPRVPVRSAFQLFFGVGGVASALIDGYITFCRHPPRAALAYLHRRRHGGACRGIDMAPLGELEKLVNEATKTLLVNFA